MKKQSGFTLLELLVVIAVIGILASVIMVSFNSTRTKAKKAKAAADLRQIVTAVNLLVSDTGKWPNGCEPGVLASPESDIQSAWSGLKTKPPLGRSPADTMNTCIWTTQDLANWNGPYYDGTFDPWGRDYWFDPDFCDAGNVWESVILSAGPDQFGGAYKGNCDPTHTIDPNSDDIIIVLQKY